MAAGFEGTKGLARYSRHDNVARILEITMMFSSYRVFHHVYAMFAPERTQMSSRDTNRYPSVTNIDSMFHTSSGRGREKERERETAKLNYGNSCIVRRGNVSHPPPRWQDRTYVRTCSWNNRILKRIREIKGVIRIRMYICLCVYPPAHVRFIFNRPKRKKFPSRATKCEIDPR